MTGADAGHGSIPSSAMCAAPIVALIPHAASANGLRRRGFTTLWRRVDTLSPPRVQSGVPAASARHISVGLLRHMRHNARSARVRL